MQGLPVSLTHRETPKIIFYLLTLDYIGFLENGSKKSATVYLHLSPNLYTKEILYPYIPVIGELDHNDRINYKIGSYDPFHYSEVHFTIVNYISL